MQHGIFLFYTMKRGEKRYTHTCLVPLDCPRICASLGIFLFRLSFFVSSFSYLSMLEFNFILVFFNYFPLFLGMVRHDNEQRKIKIKPYATCTSPIKHLICLPKFCITFFFSFHFPWVLQLSQGKLKTMLVQNFAGQIRCKMGDVQMTYEQNWTTT